MRIATFNANSIRMRLPVILEWLQQNQPDVLGIQETKVEDALFPADPIRAAGYEVVFRGQKSYNGVALITKVAPTDVHFGIDDGGQADEPRLVCAKVNGVTVLNTYVPQGREIDHEMYLYKQAWFRRLRAFFERHFTPETPVVWIGDLNVAPTPLDVHNPADQAKHVCFHEDVQRAYAETLAWGFEDVFRRHCPEPGLFSFFDFRTPNAAKRKMGWRIDHILATPPLAARSKKAWIDLAPRLREKASDHTFVAADFDL
ncbi:MAG: exodeoxyribonuclease III [Verrucomicrobia bacterium]|nr:exodeoxyribonuclease III [Verrucomicrobiota bacterium]